MTDPDELKRSLQDARNVLAEAHRGLQSAQDNVTAATKKVAVATARWEAHKKKRSREDDTKVVRKNPEISASWHDHDASLQRSLKCKEELKAPFTFIEVAYAVLSVAQLPMSSDAIVAAAQQLVGIDDFSVSDGHEVATAFAAHV